MRANLGHWSPLLQGLGKSHLLEVRCPGAASSVEMNVVRLPSMLPASKETSSKLLRLLGRELRLMPLTMRVSTYYCSGGGGLCKYCCSDEGAGK